MADINKFTTKEVLNKVLLDSSGDAVAAFSHTTQEALNAVLDTTNNRLNVSIAGGTISGDVTIAGDLTVQGDGSGTYSEIITGVLQISSTTLNGAPINLLSRDTAVTTTGEGVRLRFGKSDDSFLADFGYRYQSATDKGASISSTDNLRLALAGQDNAQFLLKGGNSTTGSSIDIRTYETTVVADDVLGKITFSAPYESSGTDAILAGAEIKALATAEFTSSVNSTDLIFSTGASEAATEKMRITSSGQAIITSAGSAASPALVVGGDDTGLYYSSNKLYISAGGLGGWYFEGNNMIKNGGSNKAMLSADNGLTTPTLIPASNNTDTGYSADTNNVLSLITEGASRMLIDSNSRISLSNNDTGASNTIFGKSAGDPDGAGDQNVYVGEEAGGNGVQTDDSDNNVGVGYRALRAITQGASNIGVGKDALYSTTTADNNIGIGSNAAQAYTTIGDNIGIGANSLNLISGGTGKNVAIGTEAMKSSGTASGNDASENVGIGYQALTAITDGDSNVAIGSGAGDAITSDTRVVAIGKGAYSANDDTSGHDTTAGNGSGNIAIGYNSMTALSGSAALKNTAVGYETMADAAAVSIADNTAIGFQALKSVSHNDGDNNTAIGSKALVSITEGSSNVAVGAFALDAENTGDENVAIGTNALGQATGGVNNCVAIGYQALQGALSTTGDNPSGATAVGYEALQNMSSAQYATALGFRAGYSMSGADKATYIGYQAGYAGGSNHHNTYVGYRSGYGGGSGSGGEGNAALGVSTLENVNGGHFNVAIGYQAGNLLTSGDNNIIIGYDADVDANDRNGCIVIGKGLSLNTASDNVVEIGNNTNSMTYDLDGGDITVTSDVRTKKNIQDTKLGLEFINKLRPITYETKPSSEYPKEFGIKEPSNKSSNKTWDGLIAQEVKAVMDDMGVEFSGWEEGINTKQRLAYGKFVMPLIKAVQELSARVKELESK